MRRILVPVDGSDSATRALRHAIGLAKENPLNELHIVNAHETPILYGEISMYAAEQRARRRQSEEVLKPAAEFAKAAGVRFTTEVLTGDPAVAIAKYAEDKACHGIVIGTRGMTAVGNLVMGSVAIKVVHLTKLPVTLVK